MKQTKSINKEEEPNYQECDEILNALNKNKMLLWGSDWKFEEAN